MSQVTVTATVTKNAAKNAKARAARAAKNAATPAAKAIGFVTPSVSAAGASLFAHTSVFLNHSGIASGPIPVETARKIIGSTAIKYHTQESGAFEITDKGLALTDAGRAKFAARSIRADLYAAWEQVMIEGKPHDAVCKNPACIKAI